MSHSITLIRRSSILRRLSVCISLVKSMQTSLLLLTGVAGYMSARCPTRDWQTVLTVVGTLALAIAGSTVINMVYDRDIDAIMQRACRRPLPAGRVSVRDALLFGGILSALGLGWSLVVYPLYGAVVLAGWFFDVVVYTILLKRRTAWSIVWGGIAGAMPVLAGRALGIGQIDGIGVLLALAILLWIPTHMLTFGVKYAEQYRAAGVPVVATRHGLWVTRIAIALSTFAAVAAMLLAAWQIGVSWRYLHVAFWLGTGLVGFAAVSILRQSPRLYYSLYKLASLYMLGSMLLVALGSEI